MRFLQPPESSVTPAHRVVVVPAPYEATVSYGHGTAGGPAAIIEASSQVEFYDEELNDEAYRVGIETARAIDFAGKIGAPAIALVDAAVTRVLSAGKWPLVLGGEHSVSTGCVRACLAQHPHMGVVQIDAHGDLREEYEGSPWSHASVMRRIHDLGCPSVGVGLRSLCREEREFIQRERLPRWFAYEMAGRTDWIDAAIAAMPDEVFLTIDVDGLDPSIVRATGTPEPGGMSWYDLTRFLRAIARQKKIIGADIVELAPVVGDHASDFAVARLAYKLIGYVFAGTMLSA